MEGEHPIRKGRIRGRGMKDFFLILVKCFIFRSNMSNYIHELNLLVLKDLNYCKDNEPLGVSTPCAFTF